MSDVNRKPLVDAAESETLRMRGNSMHGNRETLETPASQGAGRFGKASSRTPDMHVPRESDGPVVPEKRTNKAGLKAAAESVEGRGSTKGNAQQTLLAPDAVPGKRGMGLWGVREAALRDKKLWVSAQAKRPRCVRRIVGRHRGSQGKLGARCGHSRVL